MATQWLERGFGALQALVFEAPATAFVRLEADVKALSCLWGALALGRVSGALDSLPLAALRAAGRASSTLFATADSGLVGAALRRAEAEWLEAAPLLDAISQASLAESVAVAWARCLPNEVPAACQRLGLVAGPSSGLVVSRLERLAADVTPWPSQRTDLAVTATARDVRLCLIGAEQALRGT